MNNGRANLLESLNKIPILDNEEMDNMPDYPDINRWKQIAVFIGVILVELGMLVGIFCQKV